MAQPASPLSVGSLTQLTLSLAAIVGLILALGWVLKRFKFAAAHGAGDMAVLGELKVGARERIVLLQVGQSQVLIGVGAGGIMPLTPLAAPIIARSTLSPPPFAERLREMMHRRDPPADRP